MKPINTLPPFKRLCVTIGNLPSSYVDSMSYYECLMWLCKYLKETVIPAINENAEAVKEIQDWIENLDLQDEVDKKLDEMAESGELQAIIDQYLTFNTSRIFNTVSDLLQANLIENQYATTLGYYSINDGGSSLYKIVNDDSLNIDNAFVLGLENGLKALLIHNDTEIVAEKLGFKADDEFDNGVIFRKIMSDNNTVEKPITILFGSKTYRFTPTLIYENNNFYIKGKTNNNLGSYEKTTFFKPYQDNQRYVLKIGGQAQFDVPENWHTYWKTNYSLEGITFSDDDHPLQAPASPNSEKYGLLCLEYFSGLNLDVCFHDCNSRCIYEKNCWEVHFKYLSLTGISCPITSSCIYIDDVLADNYSNCSAFYFDFINAEQVNAPIIKTATQCNIQNWIISKVSLENGSRTSKDILGKVIADITTKEIYESCTPVAMFEFNSACYGVQFGQINFHIVGNKYYYINNSNTKGVDVLLKLNSRYSVNIDSVNLNLCGAFEQVFSTSTANDGIESTLTIGSMTYQPTVVPNNPVSANTNMLGYFYNNIAGGIVDVKQTNMVFNSSNIIPVAPGVYKDINLKKIASNLYGRVRFGKGSISNSAIIAQYNNEIFSRDLLITYPCDIYIGINLKTVSTSPRLNVYYRAIDGTWGGSVYKNLTSDMINKNNVIKLSLTQEIVSQYPNIALTCNNATYNSIDFIEIVPK